MESRTHQHIILTSRWSLGHKNPVRPRPNPNLAYPSKWDAMTSLINLKQEMPVTYNTAHTKQIALWASPLSFHWAGGLFLTVRSHQHTRSLDFRQPFYLGFSLGVKTSLQASHINYKNSVMARKSSPVQFKKQFLLQKFLEEMGKNLAPPHNLVVSWGGTGIGK